MSSNKIMKRVTILSYRFYGISGQFKTDISFNTVNDPNNKDEGK